MITVVTLRDLPTAGLFSVDNKTVIFPFKGPDMSMHTETDPSDSLAV